MGVFAASSSPISSDAALIPAKELQKGMSEYTQARTLTSPFRFLLPWMDNSLKCRMAPEFTSRSAGEVDPGSQAESKEKSTRTLSWHIQAVWCHMRVCVLPSIYFAGLRH